jgi:hypothetical protein
MVGVKILASCRDVLEHLVDGVVERGVLRVAVVEHVEVVA